MRLVKHLSVRLIAIMLGGAAVAACGDEGFSSASDTTQLGDWQPGDPPPGVNVETPSYPAEFSIAEPEAVIGDIPNPSSLHIADGYLYWSTIAADDAPEGTPTIFRRGLGGGEVQPLGTSRTPWGLTTDGTHAYWLDLRGSGPHMLTRAPVDGGPSEDVRLGNFGHRLLVKDGHVYSIVEDDVVRVPVTGGDIEVLTTGGGDTNDISAADDALYWIAAGDGEVGGALGYVADSGDTDTLTSFPPQLFPSKVVAANDRFYFGTKSALYGVATADGAYRLFDTGWAAATTDILVAADSVFIAFGPNILWSSVDLTEARPIVLSEDEDNPDEAIELVALSSSHVYLTKLNGHTIYRVPRPLVFPPAR